MSAPVPKNLDILSESEKDLRVSRIREVNVQDGIVDLHSLYAEIVVPIVADPASPPDDATVPWSKPVNCRGYDNLFLFGDHIVGDTESALVVEVQCSWVAGATAEVWYPRAASFGLLTGDSADIVLSDQLSLDTSADAGGVRRKIAFEIGVVGSYMRFRTWLVGTDNNQSRAVLRAVRRMLGT